ncbi:MAG: hypothetical protein CME63_16865 [Halobacteriovoraceae bacterium]|nr:hypothetical protein [Halobacteriovoraceae bacterium]|tara:strand:- start:64893 stop:65642 length:750 start_codon:yes stop_codon:yes gene_type:complete
MIKDRSLFLPGLHQCHALTNEYWTEDTTAQIHPTGEKIIVLLHGYSESAAKIYKRIGRSLNVTLQNEKTNYSIIALNGLYPLPKHFPLNDQIDRDQEAELLAGFAWYFYDQRKDEFLIDYKVPTETLTQFLHMINPKKLPTIFIGYSQGGYLAPFVGLNYPPTEQVLGINCSFRSDIIERDYKDIPFTLNQVQGAKDSIIDTDLSFSRYEYLKDKFKMKGSFEWIAEGDHWLDAQTREKAIHLLKKSNL